MSKAKVVILGAVAGAAAVGVLAFFQQQTIGALRQEVEALKQQTAQIAPLQQQLAQATQEAASAGGNAESQSHELARLRGEVSQLRTEAKELNQARQQIQNLNQQVASVEQASKDQAAAYQTAVQQNQSQAGAQQRVVIQHMNACINNLRLIDAAKQQWGLEYKKQPTDVPTMDDLIPYLGHGPNAEPPVCPDGGVYNIGALSEKPTCPVSNHALP